MRGGRFLSLLPKARGNGTQNMAQENEHRIPPRFEEILGCYLLGSLSDKDWLNKKVVHPTLVPTIQLFSSFPYILHICPYIL